MCGLVLVASLAEAGGLLGVSGVAPWLSRAQAQWLLLMGLVALQLVGFFPDQDRTRVSCIGRQILYHLATREALRNVLK